MQHLESAWKYHENLSFITFHSIIFLSSIVVAIKRWIKQFPFSHKIYLRAISQAMQPKLCVSCYQRMHRISHRYVHGPTRCESNTGGRRCFISLIHRGFATMTTIVRFSMIEKWKDYVVISFHYYYFYFGRNHLLKIWRRLEITLWWRCRLPN